VEAKDLVVGARYAWRSGGSRGKDRSPLVRVKVLQTISRAGQVKVCHETGDLAGLEEFVHSREVLCRWGQRAALLRDEERMDRLRALRLERVDTVVVDAANVVFNASGEYSVAIIGRTPTFSAPREAVERLMARAGMGGRLCDLDRAYGWVDRHGEFRMSVPAAVRLAKALALAEPDMVIHAIGIQEAANLARGYGDPLFHRQLLDERPAHALARQWAGHEQETGELRREIARLRGLVSEAAAALRHLGANREAARLLRRLDG